MISLKLSNLAHEYEDRLVFSGINFDFSGGCLAITGHNGSGKTTLLKIMAGLITPTDGCAEIIVDGAAIRRDQLAEMVGFAGPDVKLYPELTPRENLQFLARSRGLPDAKRHIADALETVGLADRANDPVADLSSGLRQRACLAAAILHRPCITLLDEPSTNLDSMGIEAVHSIIRQQSETGLVVIATNDSTEANLAAKRIELG